MLRPFSYILALLSVLVISTKEAVRRQSPWRFSTRDPDNMFFVNEIVVLTQTVLVRLVRRCLGEASPRRVS